MKLWTLVLLLVFLALVPSCNNASKKTKIDPDRDKQNSWHCPDNVKGFPPLDLKSWQNAPALDKRLPTKAESENGTSLIYYDPNIYPDAKAYNITLPKLASFSNPYTGSRDTVIVIQVVQTELDTVVGYRYLTGGNGSYNFKNFHFLSDEEIKKAVGE